jgi:hypothetical protein
VRLTWGRERGKRKREEKEEKGRERGEKCTYFIILFLHMKPSQHMSFVKTLILALVKTRRMTCLFITIAWRSLATDGLGFSSVFVRNVTKQRPSCCKAPHSNI